MLSLITFNAHLAFKDQFPIHFCLLSLPFLLSFSRQRQLLLLLLLPYKNFVHCRPRVFVRKKNKLQGLTGAATLGKHCPMSCQQVLNYIPPLLLLLLLLFFETYFALSLIALLVPPSARHAPHFPLLLPFLGSGQQKHCSLIWRPYNDHSTSRRIAADNVRVQSSSSSSIGLLPWVWWAYSAAA